ncbi:hypothetical protein PALU110988_18365 [Paenibacillus lupini]|uniref:hypothetical protein n=1 Tax=Paenibacillus lupini TaxID=1450204 RepID=UPI00141ED548|nr:hypothetical protein [Paenibacillus lupini]
MQKRCHCGDIMKMKLRTVIYSGKVEIDNVPVFSCSVCSRSEVLPDVKPDLTGLIAKLGQEPPKQTFLFNECNEWADLLVEASEHRKHTDPYHIEQLTQERINNLLDVHLIAQSLHDEEWIADINKRLSQLSRRSLHT